MTTLPCYLPYDLPCDLSQVTDAYMWVVDRDLVIRDMTQATLDALGLTPEEVIGKTIYTGDPLESTAPVKTRVFRLQRIFATGKPDTLVGWENIQTLGWRKITTTTMLLRDQPDLSLTVATDITDIDPKASWLARIDVEHGVLHLGEKYGHKTMTFSEYAVLHGLLFRKQYTEIAKELGIGESTVSHRIKTLKALFDVPDVPELLMEISRNHLIHVLSMDPVQIVPVKSQLDLYSKKGLP